MSLRILFPVFFPLFIVCLIQGYGLIYKYLMISTFYCPSFWAFFPKSFSFFIHSKFNGRPGCQRRNVNPSLKIYFLKLRKFGRHSNINFFFLDLESDHIYFSQKHFSQFLFRIRWLRYRKSESQTQYQFGLRLNFSFFGVSFHVPNIKSCQIM